ncbi:type IV toxin-antitoxin system AbiEi family antitoxin [Asticcacaulis sp. ZE23SCel15]|uniref:type IV toxin-antitoxin system AbiEi family antitoxin n=1 Tax=Asticcacaulis sp. ZE23SCel15 TaxID=3059027 RepID=UPI00265EB5C9|nr:type IV toxin-antitoxin system AbiEi family antitoxin [Asticcacaulis sp. ZE23SCel15]WKL58010.1 type IV toxin-antitoxin system AbiEi family antitoxin [Asticcacaulis sp. ZE23SCel15]
MNNFHHLVKVVSAMKQTEQDARDALVTLLGRVPGLDAQFVEEEDRSDSAGADIVVTISNQGRQSILVCEVKSNGQPKVAELAIYKLKRDIGAFGPNAFPVFVAPYLSEAVRAFCEEEKVSYFDLAGNARIAVDGLYIERQSEDNPFKEKREFKSLFSPKAASVLRVMLKTVPGLPELETGPWRQWRVDELRLKAAVSLGLVSNVRKALIEKGFASDQSQGIVLTKPIELLEAWQKVYTKPAGETYSFYTTLHGNQFTFALRDVLGTHSNIGQAVLSSFSAAKWMAPYARVGSETFYADKRGLQRLKSALQLTASGHGENVQITVLKDEGPIWDAIEPTEGIWCTSPVQTYLDLSVSGDRGFESANVLRKAMLQWS